MKLEALEAIERAPNPLPVIPAAFIEADDTIKMPKRVLEYLKGIGVQVELDENGRMNADDYHKLLTANHLGINQIRGITFKPAPEAENINLEYPSWKNRR